MLAKPEWQEARQAAGLAAAPQVVVVSGRLDLPWDEPMFTESALPVIVATTEAADESALEQARRYAEVVAFGADTLDVNALVQWMHGRGLQRIVCEGGEALLDTLVRADLVDEMDLTISPVLAGGGFLSEPPTDARNPATGRYPQFALAHEFVDEGFVFCRFLRHDAAPEPG